MTRLTFGGGRFTTPVWSRDGQYIVFQSMGNGMFWTRADGAGQPQPLLPANTLQQPASFRPDGKRLAFVQIDGLPQLWSVEINQDAGGLKAGKASRFLNTRFTDSDAAFSPDGRWLAYQSNESGRTEVYVRAFSPTSGENDMKVPISNNGGIWPIWSPNGRELLYQSSGQIMSVSYTVKPDSFVADKPRVWIASVGDVFSFDLAPDGKRIAVIQAASGRTAPKEDHSIVFVQNFFDELRRRVPVSP